MENDIHPPVHNYPLIGIVLVYWVLRPPVTGMDHPLRNIFLNQQAMHRLTTHPRKPFVVSLPSNIIGVTDKLDLVFLQKVWDGIEPARKHACLRFIHVITATAKENAFADFSASYLAVRRHEKSTTQANQRDS